MPYLDSIPLNWVKMAEFASMMQILHLTMLIDAKQDTSKTLYYICQLATQNYNLHFQDNLAVPNISFSDSDVATALNNRACLLQLKIFDSSFKTFNAAEVNQSVLRMRS
jgi:hypothetical protein